MYFAQPSFSVFEWCDWNITFLITHFFIIEFFFYFRYGFREPPYLDLALRPCFGGHSLGKYEGTISTVMKHLEKRLKLEFIKVLVCPNMDDEIFPFLHHVPYSLTGMAIRVVEFSSGGYKIRKIFEFWELDYGEPQ